MTAMQRIEMCLVNLGYIYTKPNETTIRAHKLEDVNDEIYVKKYRSYYHIVSDRCKKLSGKRCDRAETTATDVIMCINAMYR